MFGDEGNIVFANLNDASVPASTDLQFVAEPTASLAVNGSMVRGCKHVFCTTGDFHCSGSNRTGHFADVQGMANTYFRYGTEEYLIQALYFEELSGGNYSVYMAWDRELLPTQRVVDRLTLYFAGTELHLREAEVTYPTTHVGYRWRHPQPRPTVTADEPIILLKENVDVSFASDTYSVDEDGTVEVEVTLSTDLRRDVTVPITVVNQDSATDNDYNTVPTEATITAGETSKSFVITPMDDEVDDDGETLRFQFGDLPENLSPGTTTETVDDDDPQVNVSFAQGSYTGAEGDMVTVTVELDDDPEKTVIVPIARTNQGGASSSDYSGDTSMSFTFTATDDALDYDGGSVLFGFETLPNRVTPETVATSTVSIADDDDPEVKVSFAQSSYDVAEGASQTVTVTLSADSERTVAIPLTTTRPHRWP